MSLWWGTIMYCRYLNDTKNILFNDNNNWNMSGGKNIKKNQIIEVPEENYEIDKNLQERIAMEKGLDLVNEKKKIN